MFLIPYFRTNSTTRNPRNLLPLIPLSLVSFLSFFLFLIPYSVIAALPPFQLSESSLLQLAREGKVPTLEELEVSRLKSSTDLLKNQDLYRPEIFVQGKYAETQERALIPVAPVFSPTENLLMGVKQNLPYGVGLNIQVGLDQRSAPPMIKDGSTLVASATVNLDLWKNLLGKMSQAEIKTSEIENKKSEISQDIQSKVFILNLRKIFWNLVANHESVLISERLLQTASKQLQDAKNRLSLDVSDEGEVARYEAQVAQRQGGILYLQYQRDLLVKELKRLLPVLHEKNLELTGYSLEKTLGEVLHCTQVIQASPRPSLDFTLYDEFQNLLTSQKNEQQKLIQTYQSPDLNFYTTVKSTGVAGSYSNSVEDMTHNNRTGFEVGVKWNFPLGRKKTQDVQEVYNQKLFEVQNQKIDANLYSTHEQISQSIPLLLQAMAAQKRNSQHLNKRLDVMRKKFRQARISVSDLINDQDALLSSELRIIETQLQIVTNFIDYLTVFTQIPCGFNRI